MNIPQDKKRPVGDPVWLVASILIQVALAYFFGHAYDMRIFLSTGYLVGTGQNPYIAQNLAATFHNSAFNGITSFGYPPPWALILGLIYQASYRIFSNFLLYNLAAKLPVIAANLALAYLVRHILERNAVSERTTHQAWMFMLFNPSLLLFSSAWGQFDSLVAFFTLLSLYLLSQGKLNRPAILLALAISLKPIALPLLPVVMIFLGKRSLRNGLKFFAIFSISLVILSVAPFLLFGWDPTVIFQHWNAHFSVGGGLSFMTFLEIFKNTYQLNGWWWLAGWVWVPALGMAAYAIRSGVKGFPDILKKSLALLLVFFLCRAWLSEPNVILVLPLVVILTSLQELDRRWLAAFWVLPLLFSFFNTSIAQLFFPSLPGLMEVFLNRAVEFNPARFIMRTTVVIAWLAMGWWTVYSCLKKQAPQSPERITG